MTPRGRRARPGAARGRRPRRAARADRGRDVALPAAALGLDPGAVGGPAPPRLVLARGDPPGGGGDGADPRLPRSRSRASTTSSTPSRRGRHRVLVCHNISCWMNGGDDLLAAFCEAAGVDPGAAEHGGASPRPTASSTYRASSAWAPATWRRWPRSTRSTSARSSSPTPPPRSSSCGPATKVLPDKALGKRPAAGGPEPEPDPRVADGGNPDGSGREAEQPAGSDEETRLLFRHIDEPGLAAIETYRTSAATPRCRGRSARSSPTSCCRRSRRRGCAAAAAPGSRWARRPASCPAATWRSTCAATPTSPSPAPSRTAS